MRRFWVETLGCPKNQVDSDKITGMLAGDGMAAAEAPEEADLVVVNTCAFIEEARQESVDAVLSLRAAAAGAELVVTGCMAERYGAELAEALPEADRVAGFGVPVSIGSKPPATPRPPELPLFDLLNLPRPPAEAPWAYVKIAEGCDRRCGYCAIPSFRGSQRSRSTGAILAEVEALGVKEAVLVAQDLASYGRDQGRGERGIIPLVESLRHRVDWIRLLYLYPSDLTPPLIDAICATGVPYFDLSLQHVSRPLLARMRRWGDGDRFAARIAEIRRRQPEAVFRSNFIVGYPGETEADHDALLEFVAGIGLDWCGFFTYSPEAGTYATSLDSQVPPELAAERRRELAEVQDGITAAKRDQLISREVVVLVDNPGIARSYREAPEIDGIITVPDHLAVGQFHTVRVTDALGPDLAAEAVSP
ncbi:MAG: 30S ribosomal protein S12 methylthiotransferase RimO [bacterium]|nr:30S ribosomal protein S12 methylthiotransferase RimO [bacterium]MDE0117485.1 30S ribosomal protein S12 methylthiotransferase RimO [bacterium]MDE0216859.1 30S ribosomal protein S12 methylthiotransferase RimO [bacterium]